MHCYKSPKVNTVAANTAGYRQHIKPLHKNFRTYWENINKIKVVGLICKNKKKPKKKSCLLRKNMLKVNKYFSL